MQWSDAHVAGFLLAATLANDRAAREAVPGLSHGARGQLQTAAESLAGLDSTRRRRLVAGWVARIRPVLAPSATCPARARTLLATQQLASYAGGGRSSTPAARTGFAPEPGLVQTLRRVAASRGAR